MMVGYCPSCPVPAHEDPRLMWVALGIFCVVFGAIYVALAVLGKRDRAVHDLWLAHLEARRLFMQACDRFLYDQGDLHEGTRELIMLGLKSFDAFERFCKVRPGIRPDEDWLNSIRWVYQKVKFLG